MLDNAPSSGKQQAPSPEEKFNALIDTFCHEIRNPLTIISGLTEEMLYADHQSPENQQSLSAILATTKRIHDMTENILAYSRLQNNIDQLRLQTTNLEGLIQEVIDDFSSQIQQKQLNISILGGKNAQNVIIDPIKMSWVIKNLLENAIKFSPNQGYIWIAIYMDEDCLKIKIQDQGIGIPENELEQIFEKFFQSSRSKKQAIKGTGIGLNICRKAVELHGGKIWAQNNQNRGSVFTIKIPRSLAPTKED